MSMQTPINGFSDAGAAKLREMSENSDVYMDFLKFQGRVFKQSVNVALEFFTQKPESRFIATPQQWERTGFTIAQGSKAIRFADHSGQVTDYYDFSQVEEEVPPYLWTIHAGNAGIVKEALGIPKEKSLITGIINQTLTTSHITACMAALQVPIAEFPEFSKAYLNAVQVVIAGRLEVGGSTFKLPADTSVLKMLETDEQKLAFLTYTAKAAKDALKIIENVVQNEDIKERMKRNDIRSMAETDGGRTESGAGRGTAEHSAGTAEEQADSSTHEETGRRTGLGDNTEGAERQQHEMVPPVHDGDRERSGVLVPVQSGERHLHSESDRDGTLNGGGADRELRHEVDPLHGGTVPPSGDDHEIQAQVLDDSTVGGQEGMGLSGTAGRAVREDESQTGGVQRGAGVGADQSVLHGQHGDEGESLGTGDGALTAKVNSVFAAAETEEASSGSDDAFDLEKTAELPAEQRLKLLTEEIVKRTNQFTALTTAGDFEKAADVMEDITELSQIAAEVKTEVQHQPITVEDVQQLRDIRPKRKSVQNMLESEAVQTTKFETLLHSEFGEQSAYEMRKGNASWLTDDTKEVSLVGVPSRSISSKRLPEIRRDTSITRGTFTNPISGLDIIFSKRSIEEIVAKAIQDDKRNIPIEARIASLYRMRELIENSVCFDSQISDYDAATAKNKSPNTLFMHQMYGVMRYDGDYYLARLSVEESYTTDRDNNFTGTSNRIYNLRDMKITPIEANRIFDPAVTTASNGEDTSTSVTTISIPQLYEIVKTHDPSFFENPTAIGRDAREAELYTQAEYQDALIAFETGEAVIPTEADAQLDHFADARSMTTEEAAPIMQDLIAEYIETIEEEQAAADSAFEEKIHAAFTEVRQNHTTLNESQRRCLKNLEKFAIEHQVHTDLAAEALNPETGSSFAARYGGRSSLSRIFNKRWNAIEKELHAALAKQFAPAEEKVDTYSNFEELEPAHLTSEVFISYAASVIQDDRTVQNSHENSDKENFVLDVHAAIDRITTELMTMERTIEDYPQTEVAVYIDALSKDADLHSQIYDEITESVDTGLILLEEVRKTANEADLSFSDKFNSGADDASDPLVYDGSMSPEDARKSLEKTEATDTFEIYQLKRGEENRDIRFEGIDYLEQHGYSVDFEKYELVYSGELTEKTSLEDLFYRFNEERPADFTGHSMSVSDVVVFKRDGVITANYVDSVGFREIPDFLPEQKQEQFERELITDSPVIDLPEYGLHVDLAEVRNITFNAVDVSVRGTDEEIYSTTREFSYNPESKHIILAEVSNDLFDMGHESPVKHEDAIAEIKGILAQYHDNLDVTIRHTDGSVEQFVPVQPKSDTAQATEKIHQIFTYSHDDAFVDDRMEYATMDEAVEAGRQYLADGWDGFAILNTAEHRVELYEGDFPLEGVFSEQVYQNSGEWHRVQATPNLVQPVEEKTDNIHEFAELFGLDEEKLRELVEFKHDETTINQSTKLRELHDTKDLDKVRAYFEGKEGAELSTIHLNARLNRVLRDFVLYGDMPEKIGAMPEEQVVESTAAPSEATEKAPTYSTNSDPEVQPAPAPAPTVKKHLTRSERLYKEFAEMFPDLVSGTHIHERYGNVDDAYEPLSVEHLGGDQYSFMTYYIQEGDLMRDPDFTFTLDHEAKTLTIMEYQQDGVPPIGTIYQRVHDEHGNPDRKLLAALEQNFLQVLKNARYADRPLAAYTDSNGEVTKLETPALEETETIESVEISTDRTPELRAVLNAFSEKHGLGELNIEDNRYNWKLTETLQDGTVHQLGEINNPDPEMPFTPENLHTALETFEAEVEMRKQTVSDLYGRKALASTHGGVSALPKVQADLPEITYAHNPADKVSDNLAALRELKRLERAERNGQPLYDRWTTQQDSENALRRYCGWGGLPQVFDETFSRYEYARKQLQNLLTPEEYAAARESTLNAHYTPQIIIDAMYTAIQTMDLPRDARILEPACGTGNFITRKPHSLSDAEVVGVEIDNVTARIAKQLHRNDENVTIMECGFERSGLTDSSFDLAIGNVPFGSYKLNDPDYAQDWLIHDAFFRKALDKVAAGGVVAFVTSSGTMDKASPKVREYLATQAELVGAIRLPNTAFADAGTKVTSDIIFLKKREHPLQAHEPKPDWCYTIPNADGLKINSYFVQNPQMVLGKMEQTTHFDMLTCTPHEGADLKVQLSEAIKNLNAKISVTKREKAIQQQRGMIEPWGKNFSYQVQDGKVYYRETDTMQEVKGSKKDIQQLAMLCELRDVTRKLLDMQKTSASDEDLLPIREKLNEVYDAYKKEFGAVSEKKVKKLFGADSDFPIIQSLETHSEETQQYEKADIFFRRTVNPMAEITAVQTAEEALQVSLDQRGFPNIVYMATLLREQYPDAELPEIADKVCTELLDKGAIFIDPEKCMPDMPYSGVVERSEYLSGNVRMKHTMALEYAKADPLFERNAAALAEVIPEDIRAEEIAVQMGCPWIEPQDYTAFLQHLSGRSIYSRNSEVSYSPVTGEFAIMNAGSKKDLNLAETTTYGTADYSLYQLAEKILNQRRIAVMREKPHPKDPSKTITRTDPRATKLAMEKAKLIREEFKKWIFADPARKAKYERKYNDIFNSLVGREYDGSKLTFPGMSAGFVLRPHQKDCVARAIYGGNTLAAHVVGAGKSAVMFSTVMKKKELGLIHKACVVVPKALTEQVASEWRKLYPDAKLLTVTSDDLSSEAKRKLFTARVATGSYDAVIMSQEQFEKISMSKAYRVAFMQKELDKLEDMLSERKRENSGKRDFSIKNLETAKKRLKARIEKLTDPKAAARAKDDLLEFEQLGFDYLVCDEAHAYKNGFVTTKMTNVAGVTTRPSGRAEDMQMKTDYFNEQFGQGHILFCTGTPVSNSMTELYVMTRYLRPDLLEQAGVARFDDWAATFGNVVTKNQQGADGTLKLRTSFASFANLPELMAMYKEFADVQSADKLQLPRPKLKTGKPQIVSVPATPEQKAYVQSLAERARAIAAGLVEPHEDNLLKITGEARLIGLGNAAIRSLYEKREEELPIDFVDGTDSKVDACIRNVSEIYQQTADTRGVQIIFSDIAVNADHGNFSVYDYLKEQLIAAGIPEEEIIFAPKSDAKNRADIFRDINDAKYRVVIASTGTLGTGANIQQNLCALHHIDVPWKPSDFEQREGRILRQGNRYDEVQIFNYVTEGTLDSYLYQTVTDKARFIAQLLDDKCPARVSEDCDEKVLTFGEIQAAAEGNPDFKRRIELANEIAELTMLRTEYTYETGQMQRKVESIPAQIEKKKETLAHIQSDKKTAEHISELVLRSQTGHTLIDRKAINAYLLDMAQKKAADPNENVPSVTISGFEVSVRAEDHLALGTEAFFTVKGEYTYTCSAGLTENQDNYQRLCNLFAKGIAKSEEDTVKAIADLETNLQQATERVGIPWQYEAELEAKTEELNELELRLAGLSVQEDDVCDAEEVPIVETAEEVQKRKETYGSTDDNDFQPVDDDMTPPTNGTPRK